MLKIYTIFTLRTFCLKLKRNFLKIYNHYNTNYVENPKEKKKTKTVVKGNKKVLCEHFYNTLFSQTLLNTLK